MFEKTLDFLSEKARGLILTVSGTGVGTVAGAINENVSVPLQPTDLHTLQVWVYVASLIVAGLTTISYLYKFYKWCKSKKTE